MVSTVLTYIVLNTLHYLMLCIDSVDIDNIDIISLYCNHIFNGWFIFQTGKICCGSGGCNKNGYTACCEYKPHNTDAIPNSYCEKCPKWVDENGKKCRFCVTVQGITTTRAPPPPTTTTTKGGCFPSRATVSLENGNSIVMSKLRIGDKIQTGMYF